MPGLLPDVDPDGLLEFSVVYTDRALNHMSHRFIGVMGEVLRILKTTYHAHTAVIVPGSGTFGMEAVARQFANRAKVLIVRNGWFSYRWTQIFDEGGLGGSAVICKARPQGTGPQDAWAPCPAEEVAAAIRKEKPQVVFAPHVETASGIVLPDDYIQTISAAAHEVGALMVLDCVASGAIWVDMQKTGVDVLITAQQGGPLQPFCGAVISTSTPVFCMFTQMAPLATQSSALSTLRVSGRDVRWFADAELKQPVASGNTYRTKLTKATTFYLTQGYYPSAESPVVPITIQVASTAQKPARPTAPAVAPPPKPVPADTLPAAAPVPPVAPPAPAATPAPVVLPKVLFKLGKAELLPESSPALDKLAADLQANPALRLRIAGHTDRIGEPGKNQVLSEQRATAVKDYLVKAGVAAARLEPIGYGDNRPLYPSPDVRNRRVEVEQLP